MNQLEEQMQEQQEQQQPPKPTGKFIRIKPFALIMIVFVTILVTAALTIFALTFGETKVVEVKETIVERPEFTQLYNAYDELKKNYYVDINDEEVIHGAINGMFDALNDPYSDYMNKEEATSFNEDLSSSFQGIGAEIQERGGYIMVVAPIKNSPAEKAGILAQDYILAVDGESIQGLSATEAVLLIRGEKGTEVTLSIRRGEEMMDITIVRDEIPIETVYGELDENNIAHIQITSFSEKTFEETLTILEQFEAEGMEGIILDVRQNPGGYLTAAIEISNLFVEKGKPIVQVQEKDKTPQIYTAQGGKKFTQPVTVLIDGGSASASEILAGALGESADATIIGIPSFGKGTVQTVSYLDDGGNLKYTMGKWLTPKGNWINETGIQPDIKIDYPDYATLNYISPTLELAEGMNSDYVKTAERILEVLGYTPGTVDTVYDATTVEAVKAFQQASALELTGVLTGDTTYALIDAIRLKIAEEDPHILKAKELLQQ